MEGEGAFDGAVQGLYHGYKRFLDQTDVGQAAADLLVLVSCLVGLYLSVIVGIHSVRLCRKETPRPQQLFSGKVAATPQQQQQVSIRQQLSAYIYVHTNIGLWMDVVQAILSMISFLIYIVASYRELGAPVPTWEFIVEIILATCFLFDFFFRFYLASDRLDFFLTSRSFIDFITIAPVFIGLLLEQLIGGISVGSENVRRAIQVFRVFRAIRLIRLARLATSFSLKQQIIYLGVTVFSIILVASGFYQAFETIEEGELVPFHEALYYMTSVVVGRPMAPVQSVFTFIFLVIVVFVAVTSIPIILAQVIKLWVDSSDRKSFKGSLRHPHVLLCGDVNPARLRAFLAQLIHPSRDPIAIPHVVVLAPQKVEGELRSILDEHRFGDQVTYIRGNPQSEADLDRAGTYAASTCIVLAHRAIDMDPVSADAEVVASCLAVKRYSPEIRVYAQLRRHRARQHLLGLSGWGAGDTSISVANLSMTLVGIGLVIPGLPTLLTNMVHQGRRTTEKESNWTWRTMVARVRQHFQSIWYRTKRIRSRKGLYIPPTYAAEEVRLPYHVVRNADSSYQVDGGGKTFNINPRSTPRLPDEMPPVLPVPPRLTMKMPDVGEQEYQEGFSQELYEIPLNTGLEGRSFAAAARWLYLRYAVLLIGAKLHCRQPEKFKRRSSVHDVPSAAEAYMNAEVVLFPSNLLLEQGNVVSLYILAFDDEVVDLVEKQLGSRYVKLRGAHFQQVSAEMVEERMKRSDKEDAELSWSEAEHRDHQILASARYYEQREVPPLVAHSVASAEYDNTYPWPHDLLRRWRAGELVKQNSRRLQELSVPEPSSRSQPHPLYDRTVSQAAHLSSNGIPRKGLRTTRPSLRNMWGHIGASEIPPVPFSRLAPAENILDRTGPAPVYSSRIAGPAQTSIPRDLLRSNSAETQSERASSTARIPQELETLTVFSDRSASKLKSSKYSDHILICGANENIGLLLRALRSITRSPFVSLNQADGHIPEISFKVVILCPTDLRPDKKLLDHMHGQTSAWLSDVEWLDGSPLEMEDLVEAGVLTAKACTVLTTRRTTFGGQKSQGQSSGGELAGSGGSAAQNTSTLNHDIDAISVACLVHKLNPSLHIVTELIQGANASYLRPMGTDLAESGERVARFVENLCRKVQAARRRLSETQQSAKVQSKKHTDYFRKRFASRANSRLDSFEESSNGSEYSQDKEDQRDASNLLDLKQADHSAQKKELGSELAQAHEANIAEEAMETDTSSEDDTVKGSEGAPHPRKVAASAVAANTSSFIAKNLVWEDHTKRYRLLEEYSFSYEQSRNLFDRLKLNSLRCKWHDASVDRMQLEAPIRILSGNTLRRRAMSTGDASKYVRHEGSHEDEVHLNNGLRQRSRLASSVPQTPPFSGHAGENEIVPSYHIAESKERTGTYPTLPKDHYPTDQDVTLLERPVLNLKQKRKRLRKTQEDIFAAPSFASGRAFSGTTLDALLSEQYFNIHAVSLMKRLVRASRKQKLMVLHVRDVLHNLEYHSTREMPWKDLLRKNANDALQRSPHGNHHVLRFTRSREHQESTKSAENHPDKSYAEIFEVLLREHDLLCLGLYRQVSPFDRNLTGESGSKYPLLNRPDLAELLKEKPIPRTFRNSDQLLSYVYTNPRPDTIVAKDDLLYVLRPDNS
eukprot:gb/GECG01004493.1/.p1 GENE.gb/GECG01004493.1/~~gb/GECG01004493.1/.p1  ORF type:complete len:1657 (+),score=178.49 gb/GECG01004493.1/:1-4971(+)